MLQDLRGFSRGARIAIRPYLQSDKEILRATIREIGEGILGHGLRHWEEPFEFQRGLTWTAELDDRPVGFASTADYGNGVMLFHSDLVHPASQRKGAGTALTLARIATTEPSEIVCLGLLSTEHSRGFYERLGFRVEGDSSEDPFFKLTFNQMAVRFSEDLRNQADELLRSEGITFYTNDQKIETREQGEGANAGHTPG